MKTPCWLSLVAVFFLSLSVPAVWAQSPSAEPTKEDIAKAKKLFEEGEIFFQTGEFAKARDKYKESYFLSKRPLLLKNMALCEWKMKNYEKASHFYQAYLHAATDTSRDAEVQGYLDELDVLIEQAKTQPAVAISSEAKAPPALPALPATMASSLPAPPPTKKFKVWYVALPAALLGGVALTAALASGGGGAVEPETDLGIISIEL